MVSTIWSAPPESASSLPNIAPSAISAPTPDAVSPKPLPKLFTVSAIGRPAMAPTSSEPRVRLRNGCTFSQVISTTISAMPASAAGTSRPLDACGAAASTIECIAVILLGGGAGEIPGAGGATCAECTSLTSRYQEVTSKKHTFDIGVCLHRRNRVMIDAMVRDSPAGLHGSVVDRLGVQITSGDVPAGEVLRIEQLEARFGVSRS